MLNNRAANLVAQEKYVEAQKLHEEALAIFRELLGKDHDAVLAPAAVPIEKSDAAQADPGKPASA